MDRAHKGLNDWMDKHEGRKEGSSNVAIAKERKAQGYDKKHEVAKKMSGISSQDLKTRKDALKKARDNSK